MEYLAPGNLEDQHKIAAISPEEAPTILSQGLMARTYLHLQELAHRDIKPPNILVESRRSLKIKLVDSGAANHANVLNTFCGNLLYTAPEVWNKSATPCTIKVDIWSMGLIAFNYTHGLPQRTEYFWSGEWFPSIARAIADRSADDLADFLSTRMLRMNPAE